MTVIPLHTPEIINLRRELVNANISFQAIIQDIQECTGPMEELNELNKKGRQRIAELQSLIDKFKSLANENYGEHKRLLQQEVNDSIDGITKTTAIFKKATVTCMLNIEKAERNDLLGGNDEALVQHRKKKDKQELVNMSSAVTDRLLSLSRTLADTTQRSANTLDTLVTSSGAVDGTREELDAQGNVISQSGKLLSKYGRREQTDKFLILFATAFFFACVAYVLQKRLF